MIELCFLNRFGNSLKRPDRRRRRRHLVEGQDDEDSTSSSFDWDEADLSGLDFSQVFEDENRNESSPGGSIGGGFLGRRAHHLVNLLSQPDNCLMRNILQIWDSDMERIRSLDERQILVDVNAALLNGSDPYFLSTQRRNKS